MTTQNIEKIGALFPNCITETVDENGKPKKAINFELLKQMLSADVIEGSEAYEFTWVGKKAAIVEANKPIRKTLRPCKEESVDWDTTENLYIEGDNLEVLKLLQESYLGAVKMIYIDPPYNTGNDFIYRDDFGVDSRQWLVDSGQYDEGNRMFRNTDSNGRFHSDWCSMMYSRLMLSRNLLTDDGVIFISIDENEVNTLKAMCDEIFGASNFIAEIIWSAGRKNDSKHISVSHEYILCYFKDANYIQNNKILWREKKQGLDDIYAKYDALKAKYGKDFALIEKELKSWYKALADGHPVKDHVHYNKVDEKGIFFASDISWPGGGGPKYDVLHPVTGKPVKIPSRGWITNQETMKQWIQEGRVNFGADENSVPTIKSYLSEHEYGVPYSVFYKDGRASSKRLATLMGDKVFENPKDEEIIQRIIQFCGTNEGDTILDFFSGSATTAHALFLANVEQNINRRFILVQLPEIIDPKKEASEKARKVAQNAVKLLDSINVPHTICEIGKERIRRAGRLISGQLIVGSGQLVVDRGENEGGKDGGSEFQGIADMAKGNVNCEGDLFAGEETSKGGGLCFVRPNEASGSVDSVEHSGGAVQKFNEGIYSVFSDSERIEGGAGNTTSSLQGNRLSNGRGNTARTKFTPRGEQNASCNESETTNPPLTTTNYPLTTTNYPLTTTNYHLDTGFRVFKLDDTNMTDVYYSANEYSQGMLSMLESNVKADRTDLDLLFGCLLEWGLPLSLPYTSETIEGCTVHTYNDGDLIACFDENIPDSVIKTIAKRQPLRAVFRDSSFANSPSKINVGEVFKLLAPETRVKVI